LSNSSHKNLRRSALCNHLKNISKYKYGEDAVLAICHHQPSCIQQSILNFIIVVKSSIITIYIIVDSKKIKNNIYNSSTKKWAFA
jgi:hypothetical protein